MFRQKKSSQRMFIVVNNMVAFPAPIPTIPHCVVAIYSLWIELTLCPTPEVGPIHGANLDNSILYATQINSGMGTDLLNTWHSPGLN